MRRLSGGEESGYSTPSVLQVLIDAVADLVGCLAEATKEARTPRVFFFFVLLSSLELSDAHVYEP